MDVVDLSSVQKLDTNGDGVVDKADVVISDHNPIWLEVNVCGKGSGVVQTSLEPAIDLGPIRVSTIVTDVGKGKDGSAKIGRRYTTS